MPALSGASQPPSNRLQRTMMDKVSRHVSQRAAAEAGTLGGELRRHAAARRYVPSVRYVVTRRECGGSIQT